MSDRPSTDHPYERLADYLGGGLDERARGAVQEHLAGCSACRSDVRAAATGAAALAAVSEVAAPPGLTARALASLPPTRDELAGRRAARQRSPRRVSWPALAGAAAAVLAIVVTASLLFSGDGTHTATTAPNVTGRGAQFGAAEAVPSLVSQAREYSPASIQELTRRLAERAKASPDSRDLGRPGGSGSPEPQATPPSEQAVTVTALQCLVRGAGLTAADRSVYLEEATYQGTPAYVGGFLSSGTRPALLVIVVSRTGCRFLFEARGPV